MDEELEFDPGSRHLCPDGTCVGLVGADGRCDVCGREGGPGPARGTGPRPIDPDAGRLADAPEEISASTATGAGSGDGGFDPSRRLCDDGTCVGVVGADGRCLVCGRASGS